MTTQNQSGIENPDKRNEKIYRGTILALVVLVGILSFFLISTRQNLRDTRVERAQTTLLNEELQMELDSVLREYNLIKLEYDSVLTDKDSIIQASAREIERLIARQADYNRIRRQLNALRDITQNYVKEIDSLVTVNQVLRAENVQIRQEIQQVQRRTTELVQERQILESKVEVASALRAYQLRAEAIRLRSRDREEITDRARRAEQIKICFSLAENPIAPAGPYSIYARIADPQGHILRLSDTDAHAFVFGQDTLQFSVKSVINYQNRALDYCLYWQRIEEFEEGSYLISLFTDDTLLGETSVVLR